MTMDSHSEIRDYILLLEFNGISNEDHNVTFVLPDENGGNMQITEIEDLLAYGIIPGRETQNDSLHLFYIRTSLEEIDQWNFDVENVMGEIYLSLHEHIPPRSVNTIAIDNKPKQDGTIDFSLASSILTPDAKITLYFNDNNDNFSGITVHEMLYAEFEKMGSDYLDNWIHVGVLPGTYYAYIYIEDGNAMPVMQWFDGSITIPFAAPTSVENSCYK